MKVPQKFSDQYHQYTFSDLNTPAVTVYDFTAPRESCQKITYSDLEKHFHQPRFIAEIYFGLNHSEFREVCIENGIDRWPYISHKRSHKSASSWKIGKNDAKMKSSSEKLKQIEKIAIHQLVHRDPIQPIVSNDNDFIGDIHSPH